MLNTPFAPWPAYDQDQIDAIAAVLRSGRSNYWTGEEGRRFEREFADLTGARHAVAVANGTLAIDLLLKGFGIGTGDEVVVTSRTFVASASSIVLAGAVPVFADVDRDSQTLTAESVARVLTSRTRAILCVHLAGWPCPMHDLRALAEPRGILLLEDCAQAHGARLSGMSVGSLGDGSAWSFCQDKIMTLGEGGMVCIDDEDVWRRIWSIKDHGKSWDAVYNREHPPGFRWLHEGFGTNMRLTEMQSAMGRVQLRHLAEWKGARGRNATAVLAAAAETGVFRAPVPGPEIEHAWFRAYAFVRPETLAPGWTRDRIVDEINRRQVPCNTGSCSEVYMEKAFQDAGLAPRARLPVARELGETAMAFLVHPTLTEDQIARTCQTLTDVAKLARR